MNNVEIKYGTLNEIANLVVDKRVRLNKQRIASPAYEVTDEQTWSPAFTVEEGPVVDGEITRVSVQDFTAGIHYFEDYFPFTIPYDHIIYIHVGFKNTGNVDVWFRVTVQLIEPDGNVIEEICEPPSPPFVPGESSTCGPGYIHVKKVG
ncbi:unnamed protein product, partial [marine sediment metagenome]